MQKKEEATASCLECIAAQFQLEHQHRPQPVGQYQFQFFQQQFLEFQFWQRKRWLEDGCCFRLWWQQRCKHAPTLAPRQRVRYATILPWALLFPCPGPNYRSYLGRAVEIKYGGKTVIATVNDCGNMGGGSRALDLQPGVFKAFGFSTCQAWGVRTVATASYKWEYKDRYHFPTYAIKQKNRASFANSIAGEAPFVGNIGTGTRFPLASWRLMSSLTRIFHCKGDLICIV